MKKALVFIAFASIMAGCSVKEQPAPFQTGEEMPWSAQAVYGNKTKTSLSGTTLSWVAGDQIGVFVDGIHENRPMRTAGTSAFNGTIVMTGTTSPSVNYYAYYPYAYTASPSTTVSATLNSEQVAPFDGSANYMVASTVTAKYDEADMPDLTFTFDHQLMSIVKISVTNTNDDFASQEIVGATLIATSGQTLAGAFTFDITAPAEDAVFSTTPEEVTNTVSCTFPEASRPTLGTGETHEMYVIVNPTTVSSLKVLVRTTDHVFVLTSSQSTTFAKGHVVSLPTIDVTGITPERRVRQVVLWGDSITNTYYLKYVRQHLGPDWEVIRGGISGDTPLGIAGRQGSIPFKIDGSIDLPASNSVAVDLGNTIYSSKNTANGANTAKSKLGFTIMQRYYEDAGGLLNPCYIKYNNGVEDVEIKGRLVCDGSHNYFTRAESGEAVTIPSDATLLTNGSKAYRDADVNVIYMGANSGYTTNDVLISFYQQMIDYATSDKFIVLGFHMGRITFRGGSSYRDYWTKDYYDALSGAFGDNYLDQRTACIADALNILREVGVYSPGQALTAADIEAMNSPFGIDRSDPEKEGTPTPESCQWYEKGYWPQSLQRFNYYDDVHPNEYGNHAMAILVCRKMKELGYLSY